MSGRNDFTGYINELYDRKLEAKRAALAAAYGAKLAANEAEEARLAPEYYAAKNRVASAAETEKRNFDEYANARGLGSGAAAQGRLSRSIALQSDLNALEKGRAAEMNRLSQERSGIAKEYADAIAAAEAEGASERAWALYQESVRAAEAEAAAEKAQREYELKAAAQAQAAAEWEKEYALKAAAAAAKSAPSAASGSSGSGAGSGSSGSSGGGYSAASGKFDELFEGMSGSGAPYTYLVTNAGQYGLKNASTATLGEVYDEYKAWSERRGSAAQSAPAGGYTARELSNYQEVLSRLAMSSARQGSDPLAYIDRLVGVAGRSYYTDLMGEELYGRLRANVPAWTSAYAAMTAAPDPAKWLEAYASRLGGEIAGWLRGQL